MEFVRLFGEARADGMWLEAVRPRELRIPFVPARFVYAEQRRAAEETGITWDKQK